MALKKSSLHISGFLNEPIYESNAKIYVESKPVDFSKYEDYDYRDTKYVIQVTCIKTVDKPMIMGARTLNAPFEAHYITGYADIIKTNLYPANIMFMICGSKQI